MPTEEDPGRPVTTFDPAEVATRWRGIPELILNAMARYFNEHHPVGGFLTACLMNDLGAAIDRADPWSLMALRQIVGALREGPRSAWGSREAVAEWLALRNDP